jgi:hypothetical protein
MRIRFGPGIPYSTIPAASDSRKGVVKDYSDLARLGCVSRARITQIMNMRNLAPGIQEQLLFLPAGDSPVHERAVRRMAEEKDWRRQLKMFDQLQITAADENPSDGPSFSSPS